MEDGLKLGSVLECLQATKDQTLIVKPAGVAMVNAYIDAAFAMHQDF
jgi:hypothetical protein